MENIRITDLSMREKYGIYSNHFLQSSVKHLHICCNNHGERVCCICFLLYIARYKFGLLPCLRQVTVVTNVTIRPVQIPVPGNLVGRTSV